MKRTMKRKYKKKPAFQQKKARESVERLIIRAGNVFSENKQLANRYVTMARNIAMKFKVRITPELKRRFCKHCYKYLKPGANCRVRTKNRKVIYYCKECKKYMKFICKTKHLKAK